VFQEALGIVRHDGAGLKRSRPKSEFDVILKKFVRDLVDGKVVTSRMNKPQITAYARDLTTLDGVTTARVDPESLSTSVVGGEKPKATTRRRLRAPEMAKEVRFEHEISDGIKRSKNDKLASLYTSICTIELQKHVPIIGIGVWAFLETLTASQGRHEGTSIDAFLSKDRLARLGFPDTKAIKAALGRICDMGNTTKHHQTAAIFNGDQVNNDMATLKDVIVACLNEIAQ
jgi:hypothetical protein